MQGKKLDQIEELSYTPLYYMYMAKKVIKECLITSTFWLQLGSVCNVHVVFFSVERWLTSPRSWGTAWGRSTVARASTRKFKRSTSTTNLTLAITSHRGKPESPREWTNRLTRNKSPSEPMSAPVFNTKRTVDCTFQSKKQIANLVCDICLVFRNFMIAFNLGMDLNIFVFF